MTSTRATLAAGAALLLTAVGATPAAAAIATPFSPPGLPASPFSTWWLPDSSGAKWQYDWSDSV
ncbi:MAG: hypothetical protein ACRDL5_06715 [Solirubrobacteraceae bacterium]